MAGRALPSGPWRTAVLLGTVLPDIGYKSLHLVLRLPADFAGPTHTPAGVLICSYGACLLFQERERRAVFGGFILGGALHLLLDSLKSHLGTGAILLGYPFFGRPFGFELFQGENGVYLTLPAILLALIIGDSHSFSNRSRESRT